MTTLLDGLRARQDDMVRAVAALVDVESPSADAAANVRCADAVADLGRQMLGSGPERVVRDGREHLRWSFGEPRVMLLGHYDTVWPMGTLARWPFEVRGQAATGPGVFDMKAGIVQGMFACSVLDDLDGISIVLTSDEEVGSPTSRTLIEESAAGLDAVLVLEPSAAGAVKTGRKGASVYELAVIGRASHAGLDPERGANALVELAHHILALTTLADPGRGTTVTPTMATAGTAGNVVPAAATLTLDVRVTSVAEQDRVDRAIRELATAVPGTRVEVGGGPNRPPLHRSMAELLFERAAALHAALGLDPLVAVQVGGASDGNFTAGLGIPTLDGLGAVGDGAHAEGEHILVDAMPERAALVAAMLRDLLGHGTRK